MMPHFGSRMRCCNQSLPHEGVGVWLAAPELAVWAGGWPNGIELLVTDVV